MYIIFLVVSLSFPRAYFSTIFGSRMTRGKKARQKEPLYVAVRPVPVTALARPLVFLQLDYHNIYPI